MAEGGGRWTDLPASADLASTARANLAVGADEIGWAQPDDGHYDGETSEELNEDLVAVHERSALEEDEEESDLEGADLQEALLRRGAAGHDDVVDDLVTVLTTEGGPALLHKLQVRDSRREGRGRSSGRIRD